MERSGSTRKTEGTKIEKMHDVVNLGRKVRFGRFKIGMNREVVLRTSMDLGR
jgi:hypothetical protein